MEQEFLEPGVLVDGDLALVVMRLAPAEPEKARVPEYKFEMRRTGTAERLGSIRFRLSDEERFQRYFGQIGYDVDSPHRGHHYAARAVKLLLPLAREHGFHEIWITCDPANPASRRTCEIAGGMYVDTLPIPEDNPMYAEGCRQVCRYVFSLENAGRKG
ncbi:MAG TPA: GNAT family N-acetyltransferase [Planctomycetota bacterium]|nr:GNAT family N-acetyltransferase [Planctomycetota bacterium]